MSMNDWVYLLLLACVFPGIPIIGITMSIRNSRKFVASYPPKHRVLAQMASDNVWPPGVLDKIIELEQRT